MKQFNLKEYLEHPDRKVVTRDGRPVRIVCTDRKGGGDQPVVALFPASQKYLGEIVCTFCANGEFAMGTESDYDLFFAPEKHEGWVNIIRDMVHNEVYCGNMIYASKEEAERIANNATLATAKIEWEE